MGALKEAAVPKEVVAHLVDTNEEADIINEEVAKIMVVEEVVKEDPNLHLGEVLQTLGNNRVDPTDPNKLHGVDPKVVVTDTVGQIWAVGIKDPLKICPGITMVVAAVVADRVVGIKVTQEVKIGVDTVKFCVFGTYFLDIVLKLLLL